MDEKLRAMLIDWYEGKVSFEDIGNQAVGQESKLPGISKTLFAELLTEAFEAGVRHGEYITEIREVEKYKR